MYAKPTYRCRVIFDTSPTAMHVTQYFQDTAARLSLSNKTLVPHPWKYHIQRRLLQKLRTATQQPLHVESKILLYVRFGSHCIGNWLCTVLDLAVGMLLGLSFNDGFVCNVLQSEQEADPWHSHPAAIILNNYHQTSTSSQGAGLISESELGKHVKESPIPIRTTRHIVFEPYSPQRVLVTTSASCFHTVKPRALQQSTQKVSAAYVLIGTLSSQPFYILLFSFSAKAVLELKRIVEGYATAPTTAMVTP